MPNNKSSRALERMQVYQRMREPTEPPKTGDLDSSSASCNSFQSMGYHSVSIMGTVRSGCLVS